MVGYIIRWPIKMAANMKGPQCDVHNQPTIQIQKPKSLENKGRLTSASICICAKTIQARRLVHVDWVMFAHCSVTTFEQ